MSATGKEDGNRREISRWVSEAAGTGEPDAFLGKRRCKRFAEGLLLELSLGSTDGTDTWTATMHNVSDTGISLWTRRDLSVGQNVYIREFSADSDRPWVGGRVRHKTRSVQGYLIGLVFHG